MCHASAQKYADRASELAIEQTERFELWKKLQLAQGTKNIRSEDFWVANQFEKEQSDEIRKLLVTFAINARYIDQDHFSK